MNRAREAVPAHWIAQMVDAGDAIVSGIDQIARDPRAERCDVLADRLRGALRANELLRRRLVEALAVDFERETA